MTTVGLSDLSRTPGTPVEQSAAVASQATMATRVCVYATVCAWVGETCLQSYHYTPLSLPSSAALFFLFCLLSITPLFHVLERPGYSGSERGNVVLSL